MTSNVGLNLEKLRSACSVLGHPYFIWAKRGTDQEKFEEISISGAIRLGFLRSLVSAIRCEASHVV